MSFSARAGVLTMLPAVHATAGGSLPTSEAPTHDARVEPGADAARLEGSSAETGWSAPSWDEVVRRHGARVYRLAYRLTGNRHDAEDLAQETFVRVFRSLSRYEPGTFEGWLHRITTNLFLDGARRRARIRFEALPDDGERVPARAAGPERVVLERGFEADVEAALLALAPDFRAAVVLADIEQLPYEEIAAALGVKVGTVRSRIHRGRAQLREALAAREPATATRRAPAAAVLPA